MINKSNEFKFSKFSAGSEGLEWSKLDTKEPIDEF